MLYGKLVPIKGRNNLEIDYGLATTFNIVVPKLDNYAKTILIMYFNPEMDSSVAISVGSIYEDDCEDFCPKYKCNDKDEFVRTLVRFYLPKMYYILLGFYMLKPICWMDSISA